MNATIRTTCTDSDTRAAYRLMLNAQVAREVDAQVGGISAAVRGMQATAARAVAGCRRTWKSRTGHRPNVTAHCF